MHSFMFSQFHIPHNMMSKKLTMIYYDNDILWCMMMYVWSWSAATNNWTCAWTALASALSARLRSLSVSLDAWEGGPPFKGTKWSAQLRRFYGLFMIFQGYSQGTHLTWSRTSRLDMPGPPKVLFEPPSLFRDGRNVLRRRLYLYFQLRFQLPCYHFKHSITRQTVLR